jgi:hypothetical protein
MGYPRRRGTVCGASTGGGGGKERVLGSKQDKCMLHIYFFIFIYSYIHIYEDNIMKLTKYCLKNGGKKRDYNRGVNSLKVQFTHLWQYHSETPSVQLM